MQQLNENRNKRDVKKYNTHNGLCYLFDMPKCCFEKSQEQNEKQQHSMLLHLFFIASVRYLEVMENIESNRTNRRRVTQFLSTIQLLVEEKISNIHKMTRILGWEKKYAFSLAIARISFKICLGSN